MYGITPQFGLFWNFCINGIFPDQLRIHTEPHADPKNVVGVCVIFVYLIPGMSTAWRSQLTHAFEH
jgi:hypothetical protein